MSRFNVTYEKWDEEAIEAGDTDDRGYIAEDIGLREAIDLVRATDSNQCEQTCSMRANLH